MTDQLTALDIAPTREAIQGLEDELLRHPQVAIEPVHHFSDGIYAREITIPEGTVLTGKIHATEHLNILSKGEIIVVTEDGRKRISAPHTMVCRAGTKRVGFALTDCVWTTVHPNPTNTRDLAKLEAALIIAPDRQLQSHSQEALP